MDVLLVPLDYTGCAWEVADTAARLASKLDADAVLLYVVHIPSGVDATTELSAWSGEQTMQALERDAVEHLGHLALVFEEAGVRTRTVLRHGPIAKAILDASEEQEATMIVMGTHGRKGMARFVLGSVAEHVIRRAEVPVVTVRTLDAEAHAGLSETRQQVIAERDS